MRLYWFPRMSSSYLPIGIIHNCKIELKILDSFTLRVSYPSKWDTLKVKKPYAFKLILRSIQKKLCVDLSISCSFFSQIIRHCANFLSVWQEGRRKERIRPTNKQMISIKWDKCIKNSMLWIWCILDTDPLLYEITNIFPEITSSSL